MPQDAPGKRFVVGCVSYLNSKPLIDPLVDRPDVEVHFAVPARLVDLMAARQVDAALMPIVDYQNCPDSGGKFSLADRWPVGALADVISRPDYPTGLS